MDKNIINSSSITENKGGGNFSILVLGGSQGAEIFGKVIPPVIKKIKEEGHSVEIFQQCIKEQKNFINDYYSKNNIKNYVFEFDSNVLKLILSSDLAITRCGASTTAELAHTITPFIAVPLPNSIDNHQYLNAKFYEDRGCCRILEQHNFNNENLFNLIMELVKNKNELKIMHENMKKITQNNAYSDIENQIKEIIQK